MRTTTEQVRNIIDTRDDVVLEPFITTANTLTNYIVLKDSVGMLNEDLQLQIETYLAAHFYALYDPQYQSKQTGKASAVFQGTTGKGLELTWWGQQAILLDITGELARISEGKKKASLHWLGTLPEDRESY